MDADSLARVAAVCDRLTPSVAALAARICEIPAPSFREERRAAFVQANLEAQGLDPWVDDIHNVYARYRRSGTATILVSAHTDTVFPTVDAISVMRQRDTLIGPGIGDNSLAVAALLTLPHLLQEAGMDEGPDLLLCANVCEEGLGDLRGMRRVVSDHRSSLRAAIVLEGHDLGRVIHRAVGSRRYRITVTCPGGHSWGAFGTPSAIHILSELVTAITRLPVPATPKTTFNVGLIEGGVSVNTIAPRASMVLDLRSVDPAALDDLVSRVEMLVQGAADAIHGVRAEAAVIGDRPAGSLDPQHPLATDACHVLRSLGVEPRLGASSTDANVPIAEGIPAVCIGLTRGGNAHREDEYIELPPISTGLQQVMLLLARLGSGASSP